MLVLNAHWASPLRRNGIHKTYVLLQGQKTIGIPKQERQEKRGMCIRGHLRPLPRINLFPINIHKEHNLRLSFDRAYF